MQSVMANSHHALFSLFKNFVMKNIFFTILLLLPLTIISQTPFIEPSWDLMPSDGPTLEKEFKPINFIESKDGCYLVPLFSKSTTKIIKFNDGGEVLHEIALCPSSDSYKYYLTIDNHNDTINVFVMELVKDGEYTVSVMKHAYLFDDFSMSEQKEIWRKNLFYGEFNSLGLSTPQLVDSNGCRTFLFVAACLGGQPKINIFIKIDTNLNVIAEAIYDDYEDMNNNNVGGYSLMYNADSTQYYYVSYTPEYPYYYFMNVLDMEFDLVEQVPIESNPKFYLQDLIGDWRRNPYDGKIYALGDVHVQNIKSEIVAFKIDVDNDDVDFLRLSYTDENIKNTTNIGTNLCFLPDGKIIGCAVYDVELFLAYKPGAYYAYIPVFDTKMKKISEWYYTLGNNFNQLLYQIHYTKDDGVIISGNIRYMMDDEIYWEPYIVKFPASAFDPENIEEAHAHGLHLAVAYPNPGGDVMNIRTGLRNAVLSVYDIQGRKVHEQEITDDITSVDASNWQSGTYVWKLGMRNEELGIKEIETGKWIK